jgi:hypothetical protein
MQSITLISKKIMSMLLTLFFTWLSFSVSPEPSMPFKHPCTAHAFFPERLSNHCQDLCRTFPKFAQNLMLLLCRIHREIASGQIHDSKYKDVGNQHVYPAA